jgi:hypothetical protein
MPGDEHDSHAQLNKIRGFPGMPAARNVNDRVTESLERPLLM